MQTDLPLKRLTQLCAADLLPLLGTPDAVVINVDTLELPVGQTKLDTVLRLRRPDGREYLHLVEWQGYRDPNFLWRTLSYLSWLGQHRLERPIVATIVYLNPQDDVGTTLQQRVSDEVQWAVTFPAIRLWEHSAAAAVASGAPGLAVLSPLMAGATPALVEEAAAIVLAEAEPSAQGELLVTLGIFAEGPITTRQLEHLITRERIMSSTFLRTLFADEIAEAEVTTAWRMIEETIAVRFPATPRALYQHLKQVTELDELSHLHTALLKAADQAAAEQILQAIAT